MCGKEGGLTGRKESYIDNGALSNYDADLTHNEGWAVYVTERFVMTSRITDRLA